MLEVLSNEENAERSLLRFDITLATARNVLLALYLPTVRS